MNTISDVKFIVFDISAENTLDLLKSIPSRVILTESLAFAYVYIVFLRTQA